VLHSYLTSIKQRVNVSRNYMEVAIIDITRSPMIDARYSPINAPEVRLFHEAKDVRYYGNLDVESLADWVIKKVATPENRIGSFKHLQSKVKVAPLLCIYVAPKNQGDQNWRMFMKVARNLMHL
jgi:thioredoxin-like negative regulator of GroEL